MAHPITPIRSHHILTVGDCTGGYKAECAAVYALGRSLNLPVYYMHETFEAVVELP